VETTKFGETIDLSEEHEICVHVIL